jgi:hypothetical protein
VSNEISKQGLASEQKAAPGFAEFRFDDGAMIQISAYGGQVVVLQMQASTQGRGAAFLSVDDAEQLAEAISAAVDEAKAQLENAPAPKPTPEPQPVPNVVQQPQLTAVDIAAIVNAAIDAREAKAAAKASS